jgi:PKD repeat protein
MLNQPNTKIMKKTRMGMLAVLFISILMVSCDKGEAPVADFSANAVDVYTEAAVQFTDMSTNEPTSWVWSFGDQSVSTEQNPSHTYMEEGTYTVSLTATNETGSDLVIKTDYITVTDEFTEAEILVAYLEDPASPAGNYANTAMAAIKTADHVRSLNLLSKVYIIDIRSATDFALGHIEHAVNVPTEDLVTHIEGVNLSDYDEVSIVCVSGQTAGWATSLLRLLGYDKVYSLKWGMCSWHTDFAAAWTGSNVNNGNAAQFTATPTAKGAAGSLPSINTGGATAQDILEARVDVVLAAGFGAVKVTSGTVFGALGNYYIVNYWPESEYLDPGHIPGAMQYTPKVDIAMATTLTTLPTDKTVAVYCYTGQTSANMAAYLSVIGYNAKTIVYGANGMIYDEMGISEIGHQWSDDFIFDYPYVIPTK